MPINYSRMRAIAERLVGENGQAATIFRTEGADESVYPPAAGQSYGYDCTLVLTNYSAADRAGTEIAVQDLKALIAPDAETEPLSGDRLRVGIETFHLIRVDALEPGGTLILWRCQARRSNESAPAGGGGEIISGGAEW